jgi:hypothetical protein
LVASFFYSNGLAFNIADSVAFCEMLCAVAHFGAGYSIPSPYRLANPLLDAECKRIAAFVSDVIKGCTETGMTITSDGWTDTANRPLLNVMLVTVKGPLFLGVHHAEEATKNAAYIADQLGTYIEKYGRQCVCVVTDSASACRAAGALLEERFSWITWMPCCAHALDLVMKDVCKESKIAEAVQKCRAIVKWVRRHHLPHALYTKLSKKALLLPGATRFASSVLCVQRYLLVRVHLQQIVLSPAFKDWVAKQTAEKRGKAKYVVACIEDKDLATLLTAIADALNPVLQVCSSFLCSV